jgi:Holliday junction resolvase RusA-like endonuclease
MTRLNSIRGLKIESGIENTLSQEANEKFQKGKARHGIIKVPYIGSVLSVNHYKWGHYTKKEVKEWMRDLGWEVKTLHLDTWKLPITITCDGYFKFKNKYPDLSNLAKCTLDAIEDGSGINDKNFKWHDGDIKQADPPYLILKFEEA